jgi:ribonuclease J
MALPPLRIVPLGGLGEIGKNMMAIVYDGVALIIDAGLMFPTSDMLGVDYIIPDFNFLLREKITVAAILITHGHEDHTGAITHLFDALPAPIYATPLTCGLLEVKLRSGRRMDRASLNPFRAGDILEFPPFRVETFHVCHSIPDCVGLGIQTPVGLVVHTGDFKLDQTPVDNWPTDYAALAGFSRRSPLLLMSDSTNADRPGWTPSERVIDAAFDQVFREAPGRILVATFASLISRVQQVADAAVRYGRRVAITGQSMSDNIRMALNMGYLRLPEGLLVSVEEAVKLPPNQVVFMATGSQGEPSAVLSRLAMGRYQKLDLLRGDTVIISAHPIPGNEESIYRIINKLIQRGANVIYDPIAAVHVSGHASQEEQKLMLALVKPRYFMPVHGELRHLRSHAQLAEDLGIPRENIVVVENGTIIEFDHKGHMSITDRYPGGYVFVDGSTVGEITFELLRQREKLSRDGIVVVSAVVKRDSGTASYKLCSTVSVESRGFVIQDDEARLVSVIEPCVARVVSEYQGDLPLEETLHGELSRAIHGATRRRPQVIAILKEL